MQTWMEN